MYHSLPPDASFWPFLVSVDEDLAETDSQAGMSLRRTPALRQLPPQAAGRARHAPRDLPAQTQLLLRARRVPQESDSAVGALPRPKGLPRRRGHSGRRHAARADTTPCPRAFRTLRRRSAHHRALAGLLARTLSQHTVLEGRTRSSGPGCRSSPPFHWLSSTPSSAGLIDCDGWERLLRFLAPITIPGPCGSSSPDGRPRSADDAPSLLGRPAVERMPRSFSPFHRPPEEL